MTEWLTENARRAYPLEREWPEELAALWTPVLLDATIGVNRRLIPVKTLPPYNAATEFIHGGGDGNQRFVLPDCVYPDSVMHIDWRRDTDGYANYKIVIGPSVNFSSGSVGLMLYTTNAEPKVQFVTAPPNKTTTFDLDGGRHSLEINAASGSFAVDGVVVYQHAMGAFERSTNQITLGAASGFIYGASIYRGDEIIRDLIPVRLSDVGDVPSIGGLYDRVTGDLFRATAADAFTCGDDVYCFDTRIMVKSVKREEDGSAVVIRVSWCTSATGFVDVRIPPGLGKHAVVPVGGGLSEVRGLLTVNGDAVDRICAGSMTQGWHQVGIPFAVRCVSTANLHVTEIEAHSPAEPCAQPVFGPDTENPVAKLSGDVMLLTKNGLDLEVTTMAPLAGDLLRLTAVTAPSEARDAYKPVDMMIRGDECIAVEALPGYGVVDGVVVPLSDASSGGVIRLTGKCKPCCQCEDYKNAAEALRPGYNATFSVQELLDLAKDEYEGAVAEFEKVKRLAYEKINDYDHVQVSAVAVSSGGITPGVTASGTRCRIAVNLTVVNMALEDARVSSVNVVIPDEQYGLLKVHWSTAGHTVLSGSSLDGKTWTLKPGDTLSVVATYVKTATTNTAGKPSGMYVELTRKLKSRGEDRRPFSII